MADLSLAVIADVHGNRWALEAVLEDLRRHDPQEIVNLGDSLYGPLDPAGTARLLRDVVRVNIRGNEDRLVLEAGTAAGASPTLRFVRDALEPPDLSWLGQHVPRARAGTGRLLLCHGTPERDDHYLVETVDGRGVTLKTPEEIAAAVATVEEEVILCGHSHVPRTIRLADGRLVINPGSVGLPAYTDDRPFPHAMETGSPHARYAVVSHRRGTWNVNHVSVTYDWDGAARAARARGREDWARWLATGRAGA